MLKTTETLLEGLAANDQTRWARFYRDYAPFIENLLAQQHFSPDDAADLVHETLLELVRIMPTYRYDPAHKGAFHSLILKIAQNKGIDLRRKRQREQGHLTDFANDPTQHPSDAGALEFTLDASEEDWQRATFDMALRRVFADPSIRETSKIVFRRVAQLGEDPAAVARDLGIEANAVYQIKNRLKERLRQEIRKIQESSPDGI